MEALSLCYHALSATWPAELSVAPARFQRQVAFLARRGYRCVTFSEAVAGKLDGRVAAITFDDGYASIFTLAFPILERLGMTATVFLPTQFVGGGPMAWPGIDGWMGSEHEHELLPMSWEDARRLADAGWEVGSHTKTHPHLTEVSDATLADELAGSREACEQMLDRPCRSLAYPYGDHDDRVVAAAGRAGYTCAATFPSQTPAATGPLAWPRIGVFHQDGQAAYRLKVSGPGRRLRRSRAWPALVNPLRKLARRP